MNPRIYKKQAKRAVQLLRSHGGWRNSTPGVYSADRWSHPQGDWRNKNGFGIDGCPVFGWWESTMDGREWEESCPRSEWIDAHYWANCIPDHYFDHDIDREWPDMTIRQRRERFSVRQLAPGWRWRGGKAIRINKNTRGPAA